MLHINQAATSYPKPPEVVEAMAAGTAMSPYQYAALLERTEDATASYLGVGRNHRLFFSSGCTAAIAALLWRFDWQKGDAVITTSFEHRAVESVLEVLAERHHLRLLRIPHAPGNLIDLDWLHYTLDREDVHLVVCTSASNITGEMAPLETIRELTAERQIPMMVDAAQTVGWTRHHIAKLGADAVVFPVHKGLLGPQGIGGLVVANDFPVVGQAASCDISQKRTCELTFPIGYCELGAVPVVSLAGLEAAIAWQRANAPQGTLKLVQPVLDKLHDGLCELGLTPLGHYIPGRHTPVFSLAGDRIPQLSADLAQRGILGRFGEHCCPNGHQALGVNGGSLRLSLAPSHTSQDVEQVLATIANLL